MSAWTEGVELHTDTHTDEYGDPRPIDASDVTQCGTCLRKWCHVCTPTPASRCPFEYEHEETEEPVSDSARLAHAHSKVTHWLASLEANAAHSARQGRTSEAKAISARADDMRAVLSILDGSDDDYIRALGAMRATLRRKS